jgi:hypothetical protein
MPFCLHNAPESLRSGALHAPQRVDASSSAKDVALAVSVYLAIIFGGQDFMANRPAYRECANSPNICHAVLLAQCARVPAQRGAARTPTRRRVEFGFGKKLAVSVYLAIIFGGQDFMANRPAYRECANSPNIVLCPIPS